ncbi:MAG TPA: hypothetical protein VHB50_09260, partial [Bryobacteraceae bacterium]|nr:hypothetical protein [Bryobacteraceae bacterium]
MADRDLVRSETTARELRLGPKSPAQGRKRSSEDELAHVRAQWQHYQASAERERSQMQEELARVRTQWGQLQQRLDQERRARRLESAQSSALIARLQRELEQFASRHANPDGRQSGLDAVIAILVAVVVALAIWIAVPVRVRESPAPRHAQIAGPAPDPDRAVRQSIQQSMRRLNDALSNIPDRSPEEVFRA